MTMRSATSAATAFSTVRTLAAADGIDPIFTHVNIGVNSYTDSGLGTPATPTAGTYTIEVETLELPGRWQSVTDGVQNAADVGDSVIKVATKVGAITRVRVTPAGILPNTVFYQTIVSMHAT